MTTVRPPATPTLATTLRRLYLLRFGFAIVWAALLAVLADQGAPVLTVLLVIYPLVDVLSVLHELRASGKTVRSAASEVANIVASSVAVVALAWASFVSIPAVLTVWGVWAVLSGAAQLLTALARRRMGHQWPQLFSGGLSVVVGLAFLVQGIQGGDSAVGISGYAAFGGILFLVSALRLNRQQVSA